MPTDKKDTAMQIQDINNVMIAASWSETKEEEDNSYLAFCQVMRYRKQVATRYLLAQDFQKENLKLILDDCNDKIKQILGL